MFQELSSGRKLKDMIHAENWDGIIEIRVFSNQYGIYDYEMNRTLLMLALQQNCNEMLINFIIEKNSNAIKDKDNQGTNTLMYCAKGKNKDRFEEWIKISGFSINDIDNNNKTVWSYVGSIDIYEYLMETNEKCPINDHYFVYRNIAKYKMDSQFIQKCIDYGIDINQKLDGKSVMDYCFEEKNVQYAMLFYKNGCNEKVKRVLYIRFYILYIVCLIY